MEVSNVYKRLVALCFGFFNCFLVLGELCKPVVQPSNVPCGVRGQPPENEYSHSILGSAAAVGSLNACRSLCFRRGRSCGSFWYNETAGTCFVAHNIPTRAIRKDPSSDLSFYSTKCYDCPPLLCPFVPNPQENLIDNPGFEASNKYIGPWGVAAGDTYISEPQKKPNMIGFNSSNYLRCKGVFFYFQSHRQCSGMVHKVEFDVYSVISDGAKPNLYFGKYNDAGFEYTPPGPIAPIPDRVAGFYTPHTDQAVANADCDELIYGPRMSVDNFVIRPVSFVKPQILSENKVVNPGFETGKIKPWNYTSKNEFGEEGGGKFEIVSPGLGGSKYALHWKGPNYTQVILQPKLQNTTLATGRDRLYRLWMNIDPPMQINIYFADSKYVYGRSTDFQYFYLKRNMLPMLIYVDLGTRPNVTFDNLVITEIVDSS